jgi:UDP-N-acetylglucosamine 2-epimerase (non-hydrolysing)
MMKILVVLGTRPEAIKMAPLISMFSAQPGQFTLKVCITAQHRQMLDQVLAFFQIRPEYDLNLMRPGQNLYQLTADVITGLKPVLEEFRPDFLFVHGDTTTSAAAAWAAYYAGTKICHVEAGLRTYNKYAPFPEEMNRQITGRLADLHFAPTAAARDNLLAEGISSGKITVTGNTVIDALLQTRERLDGGAYEDEEIRSLKQIVREDKKIILVTGHRRENFGEGFKNICLALQKLAENKDVQIIYPVHLNPQVQQPVNDTLKGIDNVHLIEPLAYPAFVWLMQKAYLVLTDSGGVQEEAPSLGKPVLVMREITERPEAVEAGTVKLVGTSTEKIIGEVTALIAQEGVYNTMSRAHNPYGDGRACRRILDTILKHSEA